MVRTLAGLWINNQAPDMLQPPHSNGASPPEGIVQVLCKARHADNERVTIGAICPTHACTRISTNIRLCPVSRWLTQMVDHRRNAREDQWLCQRFADDG